MVWINTANLWFDASVKVLQSVLQRIGGLVHRVVTGDPGVVFVVFRQGYPQLDDSILKVLEIPKEGFVDSGITVPSLILTAWTSMEIDDGVEAFTGAGFDNSVYQAEAFWFDYRWVHIVHEMAVVDRDPNAVHAQ